MTNLNQQYENRLEKLETEMEDLKKAVHELQLRGGMKEITIHPSAELGRLIHSSSTNSDNGGEDQE